MIETRLLRDKKTHQKALLKAVRFTETTSG